MTTMTIGDWLVNSAMKGFLNMGQVSDLAKGEVSDEGGYDSAIKPNTRIGSKRRYRNKPFASATGSQSRQQERAARVVDVPVLRRAAMDLLARREHSYYELQQKLKKKFPGNEVGSFIPVLDKLAGEKLQSNERFAESYARYRKGRGFGYRHINNELKKRRVDKELIERYVFPDDEEWQLILMTLISKRGKHIKFVGHGSKDHRKIIKFLESRGFQAIEINNALQLYLRSAPLN